DGGWEGKDLERLIVPELQVVGLTVVAADPKGRPIGPQDRCAILRVEYETAVDVRALWIDLLLGSNGHHRARTRARGERCREQESPGDHAGPPHCGPL